MSNGLKFPYRDPNICTPDQPLGIESFWELPPLQPLSYQAYISPESDQEIQGLLPHTDLLTNEKLDKIVSIPSNDLTIPSAAQALGPKIDQGLIDWYMENFLPKAEGSHQYLYACSEFKLTTGMGINLAAPDDHFKPDRLSVYQYKDTKTGGLHYSSTKPLIKSKLVAELDLELFLDEDHKEYQKAVADKLMTIFHTFYIGNKSDLIKDHYSYSKTASRDQIIAAIKQVLIKIRQGKKNQAAAKAAEKKYHIPGVKAYISDENIIYIDKKETDKWSKEFLEDMIIRLHSLVPRFSQFPAGAQLAIMDMAYNTNYSRWKHKSVELNSFCEKINQETIDWDSVATDSKNPAGCSVDDVTDNFPAKSAPCSNFFFWRKKIGLTRNIATQILLILADA